MRLWSISFEYLDSKGLVALWREGLLAKAVLEGKTKGYTNHPQLLRFKKSGDPISSINEYLYFVYLEAENRGYKFASTKFTRPQKISRIMVTVGQMGYELEHLKKKLAVRDPERLATLAIKSRPKAMPLFQIIPGKIADWEVVK